MATKALPFVEYDGRQGRWSVNHEAVAFLSKLKRKIAIVIVCGKYRTGKSFLVNQLSGGDSGFKVGHTIESQTKGIWIAAQPVLGRNADGEDVDVIFMDSEGLGATDKDTQYDTTVFSLCALLCSTLVYNGGRAIDESSIASLGFIANLSRSIRVTQPAEGEDPTASQAQDFHRFLPSFVWVLRDFSLDLVDDDGGPISADEYMDQSLADQQAFDRETRARNKVRRAVRDFFPHRHCATLVRPVDDEDKLQQLESLSPKHIRPEFSEGVSQLRDYICSNARVKEVDGVPVTGPMLAAMADAYCDAINRGGVPVISDAWDAAAASECARAAANALARFTNSMTPGSASATGSDGLRSVQSLPHLPMEDNVLSAAYDAATAAAVALFDRDVPPGSGATADKHRIVLRNKMRDVYASVCEKNSKASEIACRSLIRELTQAHLLSVVEGLQDDCDRATQAARTLKMEAQQLASSASASASAAQDLLSSAAALAAPAVAEATQAIWSAWSSLTAAYFKKAVGPKASSVLASDGIAAVSSACEEVSQAIDDVTREVGTARSEAESTATAILQQSAASSSSSSAGNSVPQEEYDAMSAALAAVTTQLAEVSASLPALRSEVDRLRSDNTSLAKQVEVAREEAALTSKAVKGGSAKEAGMVKELADAKAAAAIARDEAAASRSQCAQLEEKVKSLTAEMTALAAQLASSKSASDAAASEVERLKAECEAARAQAHEAAKESSKAKAQVDGAKEETTRHKSALDRLREDYVTLTAKMQSAATERDSAKRRDSTAVASALAAAQADVNRLRSELNAVQLERDQALAAAAASKAEVVEAESMIVELQDQAREKDALVVSLQKQVEAAASNAVSNDQVMSLENQCEEMRVDLNASKALCDEFEAELQAEHDAHKASKQQLQAALAELQSLKAAVAAAAASSSASKAAQVPVVDPSAFAALQTQLSTATASETAARTKVSQLEVQVASLQQALAQTSAAAAASAVSARDAASSSSGSPSAALTDALAQRDRMSAELASIAIALAKAEAEASVYSRELSSSKESFLKATSEKAGAERAAAEAQATVTAIREELGEVKARYTAMCTEMQAVCMDLETVRNQHNEMSLAVQSLTTEKKSLELQLADLTKASKGAKVPASVEGLRAANKEYQRATDKLTTDLHEVTVQKNTLDAKLVEARKRVDQLNEECATFQKKYSDALAAREVEAGHHQEAAAGLADTKAKLLAAETAAAERAVQIDREMTTMAGRVAAAEQEASESKAVRLAMEKALRTATTDLTAAKELIARLEVQVKERVGDHESALYAVDGVRNELQVIGAQAAAALTKREEAVKKLQRTVKELEGTIRRRSEADAAIAVAKGGAEVTKYKLSGSKANAETRFLSITSLSAISGTPLDAVAAVSRTAADAGDVLAWAMPARRGWSKGVRLVDVSAVVLGIDSPTFKRYLATEGKGVRLDPMRCFTVIVKAGSVLLGDKAPRSPVSGQGTTLDFEMATQADATAWVYGLRCLQLRAAGYGLYTLSRLTVKLERIGLKVRQMAASEGMEPRAYLKVLRDDAAEAHAATKALIAKARGVAAKASGAPAPAPASLSATSRRNVTSNLESDTKRSNTIPSKKKGRGADSDSDDDLPLFAKPSGGAAVVKPAAAPAPAAAASAAGGRKAHAHDDDDDDDDGLPAMAKPAGGVVPSSSKPPVAPTTSSASSGSKEKPATGTPTAAASKAAVIKGTVGNTAARGALFAGAKDKPDTYVAPGSYAASRNSPAASTTSQQGKAGPSSTATPGLNPASAADMAAAAREYAEMQRKEREREEAEEKSRAAEAEANQIFALARQEKETKERLAREEADRIAAAKKAEEERKRRAHQDEVDRIAKQKADAEAAAAEEARRHADHIAAAADQVRKLHLMEEAEEEHRINQNTAVGIKSAGSSLSASKRGVGAHLNSKRLGAAPVFAAGLASGNGGDNSDGDEDRPGFGSSSAGRRPGVDASSRRGLSSKPAAATAGPPPDSDEDDDAERFGVFGGGGGASNRDGDVGNDSDDEGGGRGQRGGAAWEGGSRSRDQRPAQQRQASAKAPSVAAAAPPKAIASKSSRASSARSSNAGGGDIDINELIRSVEQDADIIDKAMPGGNGKAAPGSSSAAGSGIKVEAATARQLPSSTGALVIGKDGKVSAAPSSSSKKGWFGRSKAGPTPEELEAQRVAAEQKRIEEERRQAAIEATRAMSGDIITGGRKRRDSDEDNDDDDDVRKPKRKVSVSKVANERDALFAGAHVMGAAPSTPASGAGAVPANNKAASALSTPAAITKKPTVQSSNKPVVDDDIDLPTPPPARGAASASLFGAKGRAAAGSSRAVGASRPAVASPDSDGDDAGYGGRNSKKGSFRSTPGRSGAGGGGGRGGPPPDSDEDEDAGRFGMFGGR